MSFQRRQYRDRALRLGAVVGGSTLALTMGFFGIIALASGEVGGALGRLPLYVFALAATFVGSLVAFEEARMGPETMLKAAVGAAAGNFILVGLASEGLVYVVRYPGSVVSSQLFVYVLSAGMIATGLGFWVANHYDEVGVPSNRGL
ncbi:MAG: hypothetical protein V5A23_02725 [Halobacteriales archaeon]